MASIAPLHIGHVGAAFLMAGEAFLAIGATCRVLVMACRALAVPVIVVRTLGWNRLVAIRASGPREGVRLVARLTLVAMSA